MGLPARVKSNGWRRRLSSFSPAAADYRLSGRIPWHNGSNPRKDTHFNEYSLAGCDWETTLDWICSVSRRPIAEGVSAGRHSEMHFATAEQLAQVAVFMCSPAASEVRGVAWNVDGGWVAQ